MNSQSISVLLAEDTDHDVRAIERCWAMLRTPASLRIVRDGVECMDYLFRRAQYSDPASSPRPGLLLTDYEMPKVGGLELLRQIKSSPELKRLPVIMLSSGPRDDHIADAYALGASAVFTKPIGRDELLDFLRTLMMFWGKAHIPLMPDEESRGAV